jgi:hypothetical protein
MASLDIIPKQRLLLDMNRYQWMMLFAAWLGWGFDVFDCLLFNYVAPNCVPSLLGIPLNTPGAKAAALAWTGILTSLLLIGWAAGESYRPASGGMSELPMTHNCARQDPTILLEHLQNVAYLHG